MVLLQLLVFGGLAILFFPAVSAFADRLNRSQIDQIDALNQAKLDAEEEKKRADKGAIGNTIDTFFGEGSTQQSNDAIEKFFTDLGFLNTDDPLPTTGALNKNNSIRNETDDGVQLTEDITREGITIPAGNLIFDDGSIAGQSPTFSVSDSERAIINARRKNTGRRFS